MSSHHWGRVKDILAAVLEESPDRRATLLDERCAGDEVLRREVESLLRADAGAATFHERPLLDGIDVEPPEPNLGRTLGPYIVEECVGRGGMGAVYLARRADQVFERRGAIQMIRRRMGSELVIRRFRPPPPKPASPGHPHIPPRLAGGPPSYRPPC